VNLPERPPSTEGALVPRPLSNEQFEMVIRRAAELQARSLEDAGASGVSEEEVLRIGRELGLSAQNLHRALAEVRTQRVEESGGLVRFMGPATVSASRSVPGSAPEVKRRLEDHLLSREYLTVFRRLPDRTIYKRAGGIVAAIGRTTSGWFGSAPQLLKLEALEVAVEPLEEGFSYVTLCTDLQRKRTEYVAGAAVSAGAAGGVTGLALATIFAPPLGLVGLPVMAGVYYGVRWGYSTEVREIETQLAALLDRLEHGELPARRPSRFVGPPR